jgi:hypothetical protein
MAQAMASIPDLSLVTIFTSDSGSGFDYNPDTYAPKGNHENNACAPPLSLWRAGVSTAGVHSKRRV